MKYFPLKSVLRKLGYDLISYGALEHSLGRRGKMMRALGINTVLDVGANIGQYAKELRNHMKFNGRIVSFEPLSSEFEILFNESREDDSWDVFNYALGATDGNEVIHVAGNSQSSSILEMMERHENSAPESSYIDSQQISVFRLDSIFESICSYEERSFLKIDVQGYEEKVLEGAVNTLSQIPMLQVEMSLVPLYQGELLMPEMIELLRSYGYILVGMEPGFSDGENGQLLQVDGIFAVSDALLAAHVH
jgi:FkbM family methyltransferase